MRVGLVAPLPPQVGGVASVAEWLLDHAGPIGCRYTTFDLRRSPEGAPLRVAAAQVVLLAQFAVWLRRAPRLVHYCVTCSPGGVARDVLFLTLVRLTGRSAIAHVHGPELADPRPPRSARLGLRAVELLAAERVAVALARLGISSASASTGSVSADAWSSPACRPRRRSQSRTRRPT